MQVVINVDETQFKALMEESLKEIPKEKIHEIIVEGIRNYITPEVIKTLFVSTQDWYGQVRPTSYLKEVISKNIPDDTFAPLVDEIVQQLKDNYDEVLRVAITDLLISGMSKNNAFENAVSETLYTIRMKEGNR